MKYNADRFRLVFGKTLYLFKMNFRTRYAGTNLGKIWAILGPLLQMSLYIFVFGFVMKSKMPGSESSLDYIAWLLCGYGPWIAISDGILTSAYSLVAGTPILKNFSVPVKCFPISASLIGLPSIGISLVVISILLFLSGRGLTVNCLWVLAVIPLLFFLVMGLGLILSTITVFVRDLIQILNVFLMALMFFTPIFYSVDQMPPLIQHISLWNPINHICIMFREALIENVPISAGSVVYVLLFSSLCWALGLWLLKKLSGYFESAL